MYEKITSYLDAFEKSGGSAGDLNDKIKSFVAEFTESEWMNPNAMEAMGERMWASKSALRAEAPTMSAEDACICLSAFIQQETFIPGILLDLIQQDVIPQILKRLKELDS